ncbi:hypothetical protein [Anoxynatronum sibiricum]|uniref:hypothetical protein n=1 Tax=Anoxynatronum sibiricum TaxID=210623 RepID=UPI0031B87523
MFGQAGPKRHDVKLKIPLTKNLQTVLASSDYFDCTGLGNFIFQVTKALLKKQGLF